MIDLAYSALIYDDKELANEVLKLEEEMDHLRDLLNMQVMLAVRDAEEAESSVGITSVALATDKISDAAADMVFPLLKGISLHKAIREAVQTGKEMVEKVELRAESPLAGKTVRTLHSSIGVDIIAIRYGEKWMINPEEDVVLLPKSILIARGASSGLEKLRSLAAGR